MNIAVLGACGHIGQALVYYLRKADHVVYSVDLSLDSDYVVNLADRKEISNLETNWKDWDLDVIISACPYFLNDNIAKAAIRSGIFYADLGGHVATENEIHTFAEHYKTGVFTSLGLAPGYVNIIAEEVYKELGQPYDITMYCGGLPVDSSCNPLGYFPTWSIEGLLNEYEDDCQILRDGRARSVPGMSELETVFLDDGQYECFHTSGGISHSLELMQNRGVRHCSYKTLRYPGHATMFKWLRSRFGDTSLIRMLEKEASQAKQSLDKVIVGVSSYSQAKETKSPSHSMPVRSYLKEFRTVLPKDGFSAMQRATAIPTIAAILSKKTKDSTIYSYNDVDVPSFNELIKNYELHSI